MVCIVISLTLLICLSSFSISLSSFSISVFSILIPADVYLKIHTHFHPLPYLYNCIAIFICVVCVMFYTYTHVFVYFLLFPKLNRHLCYGVYWCNHTPAYILNPLISSVLPLCNLYIHYRPVLVPTLLLQTSKLYNDMHVWIHWNSIETWLQSKYHIKVLHMININNEMSKSNKFSTI